MWVKKKKEREKEGQCNFLKNKYIVNNEKKCTWRR